MTVTQKVPRNGGAPTPSPVPSLISATVEMVPGATMGPYILYGGSSTLHSPFGVKYGVTSGQYSDTFKDAGDLGDACGIIDTNTPNSNSLSSSSYSRISNTATSIKPGSSLSALSVTIAQPQLDQQKPQRMGMNKVFEPTISTKYTRSQSKGSASITTRRSSF